MSCYLFKEKQTTYRNRWHTVLCVTVHTHGMFVYELFHTRLEPFII